MKFRLLTLAYFFIAASGVMQVSHAQSETAMAVVVKAAMQGDIREDDVDRDANRKPVETLDFFGITPEMKVLELIPGGGWYTKLLGPALREKGELHVSLFTNRAEALIEAPSMDKVKIVGTSEVEVSDGNLPRLRTINQFTFNESGYDAVLTFRNMHNFDDVGRMHINEASFKALKSGGIYGVVDHTRRHNEAHSDDSRRRADPVTIIKEVQAAGFEFVDFSDLHYRPTDDLTKEVGEDGVSGNSDRFTFLFRKP